jgi:hypothetical protein
MPPERRQHARRSPDGDETLSQMRLRTGPALVVVDVSDGGALVEGEARLRPGTHVEVHVVTRDGRTLVRGRITRACVFTLTAASVRYRAGLAFDREVNTASSWVVTTPDGALKRPDG